MTLYNVENTVAVGQSVTVYLDGVEQKNCFEADTENGYVLKARLNDAGEIFVDGFEVATERLEGVVTVVPLHAETEV